MKRIILALFLIVSIATVVNGENGLSEACNAIIKNSNKVNNVLQKLKTALNAGTIGQYFPLSVQDIENNSSQLTANQQSCIDFLKDLADKFRQDLANDKSTTTPSG